MVEERQRITSHEDSEDEIYTAEITRSTQKVPLLNKSPPKLNIQNTTVKHVLVIRDEDDSGISESASEESNIISELPNGEKNVPQKKESLLSIVLQIFFPYLVAGFGMMFAGFLLDYVQVRMHVYSVKTLPCLLCLLY